MGLNRFCKDLVVREGTFAPIAAADYHPSHPIEDVRSIWTDDGYRTKYGSGSGWGYFYIETGTNDKLDFNEGSGEVTATLVQGGYDADTLAAEIETRMEAAGGHNYTVSYSDVSNKFTIQDDTGTVTLLWNTGTNTATTVGGDIGFDTSADDSAAASHSSDYIRIHNYAAFEVETVDQSAVSTTFMVVLGLNLTSSYQILKAQRWTGSAWQDLVDLEYNSTDGWAIGFWASSSATQYRVLIRDWTNPQLYAEVGTVLVGTYEEISRGYEYGASFEIEDTSKHAFSKQGYLNVQVGYQREVRVVEYEVMATDEAKLLSFYRAVGRKYPFVFVKDADDPENTMEYAIFISKFGEREEDAYFHSVGLAWAEVK